MQQTSSFDAYPDRNELLAATPASLAWIALLSGGVLIGLLLVLAFCEVPRVAALQGVVQPSAGLVSLRSPTAGNVAADALPENLIVVAGQPVISVRASRDGLRGMTWWRSSAQTAQGHIRSLEADVLRNLEVEESEGRAQDELIKHVELEQQKTLEEREVLRERLKLKSQEVERSKALLKLGYLTATQVDRLQDDYLLLQQSILGLDRSISAIGQSLLKERADRRAELLRARTLRSGLHREIAEWRQRDSDLQREAVPQVVAPVAGQIAAWHVKPGQSVEAGTPLAALIPAGSVMVVDLCASARALPFIRPGQEARLSYSAFPSEEFGTQLGVVESVDKAGADSGPERRDCYRVRVRPASQAIQVQHKELPLVMGSSVEATITTGRRRLYALIAGSLFDRETRQ